MRLAENYHTHTFRCGHASGEDREYVETAIAAGFRVLGFSDHAPMPFPDGHESPYRCPLNRADDYFASLSELRREYRADIDIRIGFEVEYYPAIWEQFLDFVAPYPLDFLILGQHFIVEEKSENGTLVPSDDPARLQAYLDCLLAGVETGRFLYVAHPDMIRFTGDDATYAEHVVPFLRRMKELRIPMEINRLGLSTGRTYPTERFFRLCAEIGNRVVIGVDAHAPDHLVDPAIGGCFEFARRLGIEVDEHPFSR